MKVKKWHVLIIILSLLIILLHQFDVDITYSNKTAQNVYNSKEFSLVDDSVNKEVKINSHLNLQKKLSLNNSFYTITQLTGDIIINHVKYNAKLSNTKNESYFVGYLSRNSRMEYIVIISSDLERIELHTFEPSNTVIAGPLKSPKDYSEHFMSE